MSVSQRNGCIFLVRYRRYRSHETVLVLLALSCVWPVCQAQSFRSMQSDYPQADPLQLHQQDQLFLSYGAQQALTDIDEAGQAEKEAYLALLSKQHEQIAQKILLSKSNPVPYHLSAIATPMSQAPTQIPRELAAMRSRSDMKLSADNNISDSNNDPYAASNMISISPAQIATAADMMPSAGYFAPRPQQGFIESPHVYGGDVQMGPQVQMQMPPPPPTMTQMDSASLVQDQTMPVERYARKRKNYGPVDESDDQNNANTNNNVDDDRTSTAFYQELHHQQLQHLSPSQQPVQMTPTEQQQQQVAYMSNYGPMHNPMQFPFQQPMAPASVGNYVPFDRAPSQPSQPSYSSARQSMAAAAATRPPMSLTNAQLMALIDELKEFNSRHSNKTRHAKPSKKKKNAADQSSGEEEDEDSTTSDADSGNDSASDSDDEGKDGADKEQETASSKYAKQQATGLNPNDKDLAKFAKFLLTKEGANMRFQLNLDKDAPDDGDEEDDKDGLKSRSDKGKGRKKSKKKKKKKEEDLDDMDRKHRKASSQLDKLIEELSERAAELEKEEHRRKEKRRKHDNSSNKKLRPDAFSEGYRRARRDGNGSDGARLKVWTEFKTKRVDRGPQRLLRSEKGHFNNQPKRLIADEILQDKQELDQDTNESKENRGSDRRMMHDNIKTGLFIDKRTGPAASGGIERRNATRLSKESEIAHRTKSNIADASPADQRVREDIKGLKKTKSKYRTKVPISADAISKDLQSNPKLDFRARQNLNGSIELANGYDGNKLIIKMPKRHNTAGNDSDAKHDTGNDAAQTQVSPYTIDGFNNTVQYKSPVGVDEYPISDRVGERLNKLSNSLDGYFNDGFLREIQRKSKLKMRENPDDHADSLRPESADTPDAGKVHRARSRVDFANGDRNSAPKKIRHEIEREKQGRKSDKDVAGSDKDEKVVKTPSRGSRSENSTKQDTGSRNGASSSRDPVDDETLETPIGPDNDEELKRAGKGR